MNLALLEALLFMQSEPIALTQLGVWLGVDEASVRDGLTRLNRQLEERGSGLRVQQVAQGARLATSPDVFEAVGRIMMNVRPEPLSHASWEVLAIVAYRQPITRMEIEAIRQTGSERAIETLVTRDLIEEVGRKEAPGRPILYGTTRAFQVQFGLNSLDDLPPLDTLPKT